MKPLVQGKEAGMALKNSELWLKLASLVRRKGGYIEPCILRTLKEKEVDFFCNKVFYRDHKNYRD